MLSLNPFVICIKSSLVVFNDFFFQRSYNCIHLLHSLINRIWSVLTLALTLALTYITLMQGMIVCPTPGPYLACISSSHSWDYMPLLILIIFWRSYPQCFCAKCTSQLHLYPHSTVDCNKVSSDHIAAYCDDAWPPTSYMYLWWALLLFWPCV